MFLVSTENTMVALQRNIRLRVSRNSAGYLIFSQSAGVKGVATARNHRRKTRKKYLDIQQAEHYPPKISILARVSVSSRREIKETLFGASSWIFARHVVSKLINKQHQTPQKSRRKGKPKQWECTIKAVERPGQEKIQERHPASCAIPETDITVPEQRRSK